MGLRRRLIGSWRLRGVDEVGYVWMVGLWESFCDFEIFFELGYVE